MSKTKPKQSKATTTARATVRNAVGAHNLEVQYRPITGLRPYPRNARRHSPKQIQQIAAAMRTFGFTNPILIDDAGMRPASRSQLSSCSLS